MRIIGPTKAERHELSRPGRADRPDQPIDDSAFQDPAFPSALPKLHPSTVLATCHQNPAAAADKRANSGRYQDTPRLSPVNPAPAKAASKANGLRMAGHRPPGQLQFHPLPQRRQGIQPPRHRPRGFATVRAAPPRRLPVRPVGVLPATPTMYDRFHKFLLLSCSLGPGVGH